MSNQPVDILCVNETFLDPTIGNNEVRLSGYTFYRDCLVIPTTETIVDHVMGAELPGGVPIYKDHSIS